MTFTAAAFTFIVACTIVGSEGHRSLVLPSKCHWNELDVPGYSKNGSSNTNITGWHYSIQTRTCEKLYLLEGSKSYEGTESLPSSRDECEELCAIQCQSPFFTTESTNPIPVSSLKEYSSYPRNGYKIVGWYFQTGDEACRPMYAKNGTHHYDGNKNWPLNKHECDDLCGLNCLYFNWEMYKHYGIEVYNTGYCTYDEFCVGGQHAAEYDTCKSKSDVVNCCLKNFESDLHPIPVLP